MSWRDAAVPGRGPMPVGAPRLPTNREQPSALNTYFSGAVRHERAGTVKLSTQARTALTVIGVLDILVSIALYGWLRPAHISVIGDIVSWGAHWELVTAIAATAGVALLGLATASRWFTRVTNRQMYGIWTAFAASIPTTGLALAVGVVVAVLFVIACIIGGIIVFGFFWALISGDG